MAVPCGLVTLLTDFGQREPFVGVMKGVMAGLAPAVRVVDLSHDVPAHDVRFASFWLERAAPWFPAGTVHVVVVDPGVGGERRVLVAAAREQFFVGPDNGVLGGVLRPGEARVHVAAVPVEASRTFHGRDVFAPLAARLASAELKLDELPRATSWMAAAHALSVADARSGVIVVVDRFGNLISNVQAPRDTRGWVRVGRADSEGTRLPLVANYEAAGERGGAIVNAWGVVEVAVHCGRASDVLGLGPGDWLEML